jgi:hypothetical protein
MRGQTISGLIAILLCAAGAAGQSGTKRGGSSPAPTPVTDIRKVDFLNFTYRSTLCSQEFGRKGIGRTVRVGNGELKNRNVYFAVDDSKIVFGDVTGDGREDAIVPISCGAVTANFSLSEVYVYTIVDGRPTLVGGISDKDLERDYRSHYPDAESYWGLTGSELKIRDGNLEIEVFADGPHASPKYTVTLGYRLSGESFRVIGKPERRNA